MKLDEDITKVAKRTIKVRLIDLAKRARELMKINSEYECLADNDIRINYGIDQKGSFFIKYNDDNNKIKVSTKGNISYNNRDMNKGELEERLTPYINADLTKRELLKDQQKASAANNFPNFFKTALFVTVINFLILTIPDSAFILSLAMPSISALPVVDTIIAVGTEISSMLAGLIGSSTVASSIVCGVGAGIAKETIGKAFCETQWTDKVQKDVSKRTGRN